MKNIILLFFVFFFAVLSFVLTGMLNEIVSYIGFGAGFVSIMFFTVFMKRVMPVKKINDKQEPAPVDDKERESAGPEDIEKKSGEKGEG